MDGLLDMGTVICGICAPCCDTRASLHHLKTAFLTNLWNLFRSLNQHGSTGNHSAMEVPVKDGYAPAGDTS